MENKNLDISLLLLRLTFGGLMLINHGWGKLQTFMNAEVIKFPDPLGIGASTSMGLAVFAEVVCAALIVVGLFTRLATVPALITMLVAIFIMHWADPFADKETAILYAIPYLAILLMGAGRYSVDHLWSQRNM